MRQKQYQFISHLSWGFLLLLLNVNISGFDLVPEWPGYVLFLIAINRYGEEKMKHVRLLTIVLTVVSFAGWVMGLLHMSNSFEMLEMLEIAVDVANVYLLYQILEEAIEISEHHNSSQTKNLINCHRVNILCEVLLILSDLIGIFTKTSFPLIISLCVSAGSIASMLNVRAMTILETELLQTMNSEDARTARETPFF